MADVDGAAAHFVVVDFWNDRGQLSSHIELRCSCGDWVYRFPYGSRSLTTIVETVKERHSAAPSSRWVETVTTNKATL